MGVRKLPSVIFGILIASLALYILVPAYFPRLRNDLSCENSVPANSAQMAALNSVRSQKAALCSNSRQLCKFDIDGNDDGSFSISLYLVESNFFEGCIYDSQDLDVFIYTREGKLVRIEKPPYG